LWNSARPTKQKPETDWEGGQHLRPDAQNTKMVTKAQRTPPPACPNYAHERWTLAKWKALSLETLLGDPEFAKSHRDLIYPVSAPTSVRKIYAIIPDTAPKPFGDKSVNKPNATRSSHPPTTRTLHAPPWRSSQNPCSGKNGTRRGPPDAPTPYALLQEGSLKHKDPRRAIQTPGPCQNIRRETETAA